MPAATPSRTVSGFPVPIDVSVKVDGRSVWARLQEPRTPRADPPPAIVIAHGGPTLSSPRYLDDDWWWLVEEGFAVAIVDYTGSSGHGQSFRDELAGQWGIHDVRDVDEVARHLQHRSLVSAVFIRGVSAGGWTALHSLRRRQTPFAAGTAYAPVTDLDAQERQTPQFERGYVRRLVGQADRSPVNDMRGDMNPVLVIQGAADPVVRAQTTDRYIDKLAAAGVRHRYLRLEGEGHLLRGQSAVNTARQAELDFYLDILNGTI
ncbi:alpha/beta hydrolase family protein [Kribbella catacumbae]|uniref:alpha/beta hydrolase family protein n=1 Tax=Kribbella catacumbae TaxID=460086 RepID=UPI001ED9B14E|nr:prolyl oligopeptidase family serine peptidase [Kribbella catacumbae]